MRSRLLRLLRFATIAAVGLLLTVAAVVLLAFPRSEPPSTVIVEPTTERLERGRYLVDHIANCLDCHSDRDWTYYGGPVIAGTEGRGAPLRVLRPHVTSANITPAALADWTDGEIARAITAGIGRDGRPLHPFMPYDTYAQLTEDDVWSIVAHLRALPPIEHQPPQPDEPWPIGLLGRLLPSPYEPPPPFDTTDPVARGRYLAQIAECSFCHGGDYSGGRSFSIPGTEETVLSENITPHPSNRIGAWSRENFIGVFRSFAPPDGATIPGDQINTVMPWSRFAGMTDDDLGAIYDYLRTVEPIEKIDPEQDTGD